MKNHWYACILGLALAVPATAGGRDPFGGFISPVSNPVNFEDPRPTTEVRPIYVYHSISDDFATSGGDAHVVAVAARVAINERLGIIATKDGYVWLDPKQGVPKKDGWANLAFGAKYAFYRDPEQNSMATAGLNFEAPWGNRDVLQGRGSGVVRPFLSGLWGTGDLHLLGYTGARLPISGDDSTLYDLSLHADYGIGSLFPLVEVNWIQTLDGGRRLGIDQEGFDFFNIGSTKAGGRGVVTMALGARWRAIEGVDAVAGKTLGVDLGATYELPLTDREDLFGWRVTSDVILSLN